MEALKLSPNISVFFDTVQYLAFLDATVLVVLLFKKKLSQVTLPSPKRGLPCIKVGDARREI